MVGQGCRQRPCCRPAPVPPTLAQDCQLFISLSVVTFYLLICIVCCPAHSPAGQAVENIIIRISEYLAYFTFDYMYVVKKEKNIYNFDLMSANVIHSYMYPFRTYKELWEVKQLSWCSSSGTLPTSAVAGEVTQVECWCWWWCCGAVCAAGGTPGSAATFPSAS